MRPREEWEFVLRNARLYDRMGCDLLALDLVHRWEFLGGLPTHDAQTRLQQDGEEDDVDYRKLLRRRSSLVVADMPVRPADAQVAKDAPETTTADEQQQQPKHKPPPTMFHEPDANSLLDSFGF